MTDTFARLNSAAHSGAFGASSKTVVTPEQIRAGNYAKGTVRLHGMPITIETPMFQSRRGKQDGVPWSVVCMAHYGYINRTVGADGDALDVFVGPTPESTSVYAVNQVDKAGDFDEHKVMLGFHDEQSARNAYLNSYERGWSGLGSLTACSIKQFKHWLKHGDLSQPLQPADLIDDEALSMTDVLARWDDQRSPVDSNVGELLYELRKNDPEGMLMDSMTLADLNEWSASQDDGSMLDAMVIIYQQFPRKAKQLLKVMQMAAAGVNPTDVQISKPFKNKGTTQVAMLFSMDDGQSVSVFFHNPDSTPNKLMPGDDLVSWKWVLNKRDITITVAPERGQDLNPREVARRIMKLVQKNSAKFQKANTSKADRDAKRAELEDTHASRTKELAELDKQIEELTAQVDAKKAADASAAAAEPEAVADVPAVTVPPVAVMLAFPDWETAMVTSLADLLEASYSDASSVAETQTDLVAQLYANKATPEAAAHAVMAAATVTDPEPAQSEALPSLTFKGATLVWSESSMDENKEFSSFADLDAWFKATYTAEVMAQSHYSKNKLIIRTVDGDGNERADTTRVDVSRNPGDFNPLTESIADYLAENGYGGINAGQVTIADAPAPVIDTVDVTALPEVDLGDIVAAPETAPAAEPETPPEPDEDNAVQDAKAYLDSLIDGTADLGAPSEVLSKLEDIYVKYGENQLQDLFAQASDAFRDYALKVTAGLF